MRHSPHWLVAAQQPRSIDLGSQGRCGHRRGAGCRSPWLHRHDGFIFRVEPESGELTIVFEFADSPTPSPAGLTLGSDGLLYGVTSWSQEDYNFGSVYRTALGPAGQLFGTTPATKPKNRYRNGSVLSIHRNTGKLKTLFDFPHSPEDGKGPVPLVRSREGFYYGAKGEFYGLTRTGGANQRGTLFRMQVMA